MKYVTIATSFFLLIQYSSGALWPSGCVLPQCAAPPVFCNWEMGKDSNGCMACGKLVCNDVIEFDGPIRCNQRGCLNGCPNGYVKDSNGCPTCECKQLVKRDCPKPMCHLWMKCSLGNCPCECNCKPNCQLQLK